MPTGLTLKRSRAATASPKALKRSKSKNRNTNVSRSVVSMGQVFPKTLKTVLRYVERANLSAPTSSYNQVFFKCNGLFDPTDALGGHQPYGFDQYAAIYNHYKVYKSRITVQWNAYDSSPPEGLVVGVNITPGNTDADNAQTKMEKQDGAINYRYVSPQDPTDIIQTKWWTAKKYFGTQKDEDSLTAAVTADPTELSHYCVWAQNCSGGSGSDIEYLVTIEYYVEFIEPKSLGGS